MERFKFVSLQKLVQYNRYFYWGAYLQSIAFEKENKKFERRRRKFVQFGFTLSETSIGSMLYLFIRTKTGAEKNCNSMVVHERWVLNYINTTEIHV